jgi:hypothetical protein
LGPTTSGPSMGVCRCCSTLWTSSTGEPVSAVLAVR